MSDQTNTSGESFSGPPRRKKRKWDSDRWWEDRNTAQKVLIGIGFGILIVGGLFLIGLITMSLWNWLMPEIFGLPTITYWQTWGLMILSSILIKGFGSSRESGSRSDRKRKRHLRRYMDEGPARDEPQPSPAE